MPRDYAIAEDRAALVDEVIRLWPTMSAKAIGERLGITKNAVIGIAHRRVGPKTEPDEPLPPRPKIEFTPPGHCQWITGHVGEDGWHFCGKQSAGPERVWCAAHRARVYQRAPAGDLEC